MMIKIINIIPRYIYSKCPWKTMCKGHINTRSVNQLKFIGNKYESNLGGYGNFL